MVDDCRGAERGREPTLGDEGLRVGEVGGGEIEGVRSDGDEGLKIKCEIGSHIVWFCFWFFWGGGKKTLRLGKKCGENY